MADLANLERRMRNLRALREILSSLRSLSAVQLRHGTETLRGLRDYERALAAGLQRAGAHAPRTPPARVLLIVLGSDQGLCGPLLRELVVQAEKRVHELGTSFEGLIVVGRRAAAHFEAEGLSPLHVHEAPVSLKGLDDTVRILGERLDDEVDHGRCDGVEVVYTRHSGGRAGGASLLRVYPAHPARASLPAPPPGRPRSYAPLPEVAATLQLEWSYVALYRAAVESLTAEHEARLRTADGATHNLDRSLHDLRLEHHHARQEAITSEIAEIVSGSGMLQG